ncbi:MAG: helix-hairpin-helix domain-containing protein [Candidatus Tritonobacter lacicola]|nr:helix-hairpin-helix domain-containing protein [Candidatus Tritonobacter lacicola]
MRTLIALACITAIVAVPAALIAQENKNINTMTKAELMALKCGLGEVKAQRVIEEREKGQFSAFADFQARVKGVGSKTVEKLKEKGVICEPAVE